MKPCDILFQTKNSDARKIVIFFIYHFRSKRIVGVCYVVVKVSLLVVVELGIFPLICGWWLDICSLVIPQIINMMILIFYYGLSRNDNKDIWFLSNPSSNIQN